VTVSCKIGDVVCFTCGLSLSISESLSSDCVLGLDYLTRISDAVGELP